VIGFSAVLAIRPLRWRAAILAEKATGQIGDIRWSDLLSMLRPGSDFYLESLADTRNPFLVIESPRRSKTDLEAGERLFRDGCSPCHGNRGTGGPGGPSLQNHVFRQGRSDWALYRTITEGIPGTAMTGSQMPRDDVWRLVTYLRMIVIAERGDLGSTRKVSVRLPFQAVTPEELRFATDHPNEWLTYSGSYASQRHSRLTQINRDSVRKLQLEWARQFSTSAERVEASPIVRGTTMFVTEPPNRVLAIDAATGKVLWTYSHDLPSHLLLCCGTVNRGVGVQGDRVFVGTLDAHLVALDASTGKPIWDVMVGDPLRGYSITSAPLTIENMVVTGVAGGEYGARGFIDAYDASSGERRWRFYAIPDSGQPGNETWSSNSWRKGGAPTWLTGSFDPELRLIYWGVGNPSPNFDGEDRSGDNLYSNSVVALEADSGKLRWYFQFTPHDAHDWDSVQIPVLVDAIFDNSKRRLLSWTNRNGFYYLLDRSTGEFLSGTPYVRQTWADGLDAKGRPRIRPESVPSRQGATVYPSLFGGTNWWSPSYDPELELVFVPTVDRGGVFYVLPDRPPAEERLVLGGVHLRLPNEDTIVAVKALELRTGRVRWQYLRPPVKAIDVMGGLISTAGRIVFGGEGETLFALDSETGAELWHCEVGGEIAAAPVSYELAGREYLAVAAGRSILAFALPQSNSRNSGPNGVL